MTTLSRPHEYAHPHPKIHVGPRTRAAIAIQIEELTAQRKKIRNPFRRAEIDARIKILMSLIVSIATAAVLVLTPASAQARDPCGPYMAAKGCLTAIENDAKACVAERFPRGATQERKRGCSASTHLLRRTAPMACSMRTSHKKPAPLPFHEFTVELALLRFARGGRPPGRNFTRKFTITVEPRLFDNIRARAHYEGISVAAMSRQSIESYLRVHHDHKGE